MTMYVLQLYIQIQMNIPRTKKNKSTTIAFVMLQAGENFPVEYIQKALFLSLDMKGTIILQKRKFQGQKIKVQVAKEIWWL